MPFPNPANYFLPTPEAIEAEVTDLHFGDLKNLIFEMSEVLGLEDVSGYESLFMSNEFDNWVSSLKTDELINLIRWIGERLAYLHHRETVVIPQEGVVAELLDDLYKQSTNHDRQTI
jgi:hypothetical protein